MRKIPKAAHVRHQKPKKPLTIDDVRLGAAKAASGLSSALNAIGAICQGAGATVNILRGGPLSITGRGIAAVGRDLLTAASAIGSAAELINGRVVEVGDIVVEPLSRPDPPPTPRKPRQR